MLVLFFKDLLKLSRDHVSNILVCFVCKAFDHVDYSAVNYIGTREVGYSLSYRPIAAFVESE